MTADLTAAAILMTELGAVIYEWPPDDLGAVALRYAHAGWEVHPLHSWDCPCRKCTTKPKQRGKAPLTRHGVSEATNDLMQIAAWWTRWPGANIGGRVPRGAVVVDIDPREDGDIAWAALTDEHGPVATRTAWSGRGDGGHHLYLRHPGGKLRGKIVPGVDLRGRGNYTVLPPSLHPTTGHPYRWADATAPIVDTPAWLAALMQQPERARTSRAVASSYLGESIADWYSTTHTWADVLTPHSWQLVSHHNGDEDGSEWEHPQATAAHSATIRHGCLFNYSTNTPFDVTEKGDPRGYTRFRAFAVLNHHGDLSAAARAARELKGVAA